MFELLKEGVEDVGGGEVTIDLVVYSADRCRRAFQTGDNQLDCLGWPEGCHRVLMKQS
ncbi:MULTISPECIES: hypothetical protein [unclassified Cryobacterium]|uniref:hypothetical protein n=1 Tax=unclassified Cryobacterium TaxID=2649013 RepID=UPI001304E3F2|nr:MULTISPECIES: hypothetical protein [unclassified Cryobacterium]